MHLLHFNFFPNCSRLFNSNRTTTHELIKKDDSFRVASEVLYVLRFETNTYMRAKKGHQPLLYSNYILPYPLFLCVVLATLVCLIKYYVWKSSVTWPLPLLLFCVEYMWCFFWSHRLLINLKLTHQLKVNWSNLPKTTSLVHQIEDLFIPTVLWSK